MSPSKPTAPAKKKAPTAAEADSPRVIKKYPNRRLYDTQHSSYITLTQVRELVMAHTPFVVRDAKTGEDLTRSILLQIILEEEAGGAPMFTEAMLANIIRFYGHTMQGHMGSFIEKNVQMFTDFQAKMAEQGGVDAWAKMMQMPNPLMPAAYAEQMQKMQEQMQKQTEQMMGMFGIKR